MEMNTTPAHTVEIDGTEFTVTVTDLGHFDLGRSATVPGCQFVPVPEDATWVTLTDLGNVGLLAREAAAIDPDEDVFVFVAEDPAECMAVGVRLEFVG